MPSHSHNKCLDLDEIAVLSPNTLAIDAALLYSAKTNYEKNIAPQYVQFILRDLPVRSEHVHIWKNSKLKSFFWTRRMQFRQPCQRCFARIPKKLCSESGKIWVVWKLYFATKCSPGRIECSFDSPAERFFAQSTKKFRSKSDNCFSKICFFF